MTEFLQRREQEHRTRRPLAQQVSKPAGPAVDAPIVPTQERAATQIANRRVNVDAALVQVTDKDTARRGIRFRNNGATTIYLGGDGVTNETAVHRLLNGDVWEETLAAAAQWWALSDVAGGFISIEEIH